MAVVYPVGGGAPGINPADLTATAGDVVAGAIAGVKDNYDPVPGTLTLTGNAQQNHVLAGETYYTTNPKSKITGTMSVQSILSFSCAPYSASRIVFTWQNPQNGPFSGVIIVGKTGGYPTNINDGTRYYKGFGNNTNSLGVSSVVVEGFGVNITYYFRAFSYAIINGDEITSTTTRIANVIIQQVTQVFTSSTTWTVPNGVSEITIFCVGGGGGGGYGGTFSQHYGGGGGGGGHTTTTTSSVSPGQVLSVIIGSGGSGGGTMSPIQRNGYPTYIEGISSSYAEGGSLGENGYTGGGFEGTGGSGGSGGGGGCFFSNNSTPSYHGGFGGSNGSDGESYLGNGGGGKGQGYTTRAFMEDSGTPYSGGGGGGGNNQVNDSYRGVGGSYGGGNGQDAFYGGSAGTPNSGGGGGGGMVYTSSSDRNGYPGGSGICMIRYVQ